MSRKIVIILLAFSVMNSEAFYSDSSIIVNLDTNNFDELVRQGREMWVVEFYTPWCGHCQNFAGKFEKVARAFDGIVKFGAVNADENSELAQDAEVRGYPTIKIFNGHKGVPEIYEGDRQVRALTSFLEVSIHSQINSRLDGKLDPSMFKNKGVVELTEENFEKLVLASKEMWLIVFYSPFCERCKVLSTRWADVVSELKGMIRLGSMDATFNFATASDCKIEGYPSVQFFPLGKKDVTSGINYHGEGKASEIIQWTLDNIANNAPTPKVIQIVDLHSLQHACSKKHVCIVSILPHIIKCKTNCRNDHLDTLREVSKKFKKSLWGWVWSEAGAQPEIESVLEIRGDFNPVMVAVEVKKMKFLAFSGTFSTDEISKFLENLAFEGDAVKSIILNDIPDINEIEPWDGLNAELSLAESISDELFTMRDEL